MQIWRTVFAASLMASVATWADAAAIPGRVLSSPAELCLGHSAAAVSDALARSPEGRVAEAACLAFAREHPRAAAQAERRGRDLIAGPTRRSANLPEATAGRPDQVLHAQRVRESMAAAGADLSENERTGLGELVGLVAELPKEDLRDIEPSFASGILPLLATQELTARNETALAKYQLMLFGIALLFLGKTGIEKLQRKHPHLCRRLATAFGRKQRTTE